MMTSVQVNVPVFTLLSTKDEFQSKRAREQYIYKTVEIEPHPQDHVLM